MPAVPLLFVQSGMLTLDPAHARCRVWPRPAARSRHHVGSPRRGDRTRPGCVAGPLPAGAPRARADTNAGLATVDDAVSRLANRRARPRLLVRSPAGRAVSRPPAAQQAREHRKRKPSARQPNSPFDRTGALTPGCCLRRERRSARRSRDGSSPTAAVPGRVGSLAVSTRWSLLDRWGKQAIAAPPSPLRVQVLARRSRAQLTSGAGRVVQARLVGFPARGE